MEIVVGLIFVFIMGVGIGIILALIVPYLFRRRNGTFSSVSIEHFWISANHLCYGHGCSTVISYRVEVTGDPAPFIYRLMIRKNGDDRSLDIINSDQLREEWSQSFDSTSEQLFYNGPGKYTVFLYLIRNDEVFESKSKEIIMTDGYRGYNALHIDGMRARSILSSEIFISNWDNEKANFRLCKGSKLAALLLDSLRIFPPEANNNREIDELRIEQWHQEAIDAGYSMDLSVSRMPVEIQIFNGETLIWQGSMTSNNNVIYFGTEFAGTGGVNLSLASAIEITENMRVTASFDISALDVPGLTWVSQDLYLILGCDEAVSTD